MPATLTAPRILSAYVIPPRVGPVALAVCHWTRGRVSHYTVVPVLPGGAMQYDAVLDDPFEVFAALGAAIAGRITA